MINWNGLKPANTGRRKLEGVTVSIDRAEVMADIAELWKAFFQKQVPKYDRGEWESVLAFVQPWHGTLDLSLAKNSSLRKQLPGAGLYFQMLHRAFESASTDSEADQVSQSITGLLLGAISAAVESITQDDSIPKPFTAAPVPLTVYAEPGEPPVLTLVLFEKS